jgi:hypothetical protein
MFLGWGGGFLELVVKTKFCTAGGQRLFGRLVPICRRHELRLLGLSTATKNWD